MLRIAYRNNMKIWERAKISTICKSVKDVSLIVNWDFLEWKKIGCLGFLVVTAILLFFLLRYIKTRTSSLQDVLSWVIITITTIDFWLVLHILSPAFAVLYITKCSSGKCIYKCQMMQSFSSFCNCAITFSRFTLSGFNLSIIFSNSSLTSEKQPQLM